LRSPVEQFLAGLRAPRDLPPLPEGERLKDGMVVFTKAEAAAALGVDPSALPSLVRRLPALLANSAPTGEEVTLHVPCMSNASERPPLTADDESDGSGEGEGGTKKPPAVQGLRADASG
jgi:hypothetical protein